MRHTPLVLLVLLALPLQAAAQHADVRDVSGMDLGSGRVVAFFDVTEDQAAILFGSSLFRDTVRREEGNRIAAAEGYALYAVGARTDVADCTSVEARCYVVNRERGLIIFVGMFDR
ncbi:MAG: hypothetical protein R3181_06815 [Rubricoccaceae bacterium]|nr:hypothetical protein [Rubricoccaceae bacterium]